MPSGDEPASGPAAIETRSGTLPHTATLASRPRRDDVLVVAGVGAGRADHETDRQLARHEVEHRFDPRRSRRPDRGSGRRRRRRARSPWRAGARCRAGCRRPRLLGVDPVERLEQQPVGRGLDEGQPLEILVLGALDPVGGAGLRDRRRPAWPGGGRPPSAARYTDVVVLPTPPLSAATTMIMGPNVSSRDGSPDNHPPPRPPRE